MQQNLLTKFVCKSCQNYLQLSRVNGELSYSGNPYPEAVVIEWQYSVPGMSTPVNIEKPLDNEFLVASVFPVCPQWSY